MALSPEQIKANFESQGKTFSQWAKEYGFRSSDVYKVINGLSKAKRGKGHEIAVKLGLKEQPNENV